jgi:hypothetical protein
MGFFDFFRQGRSRQQTALRFGGWTVSEVDSEITRTLSCLTVLQRICRPENRLAGHMSMHNKV